MDSACYQTNRSLPRKSGNSFRRLLKSGKKWDISTQCKTNSYTDHASTKGAIPDISPRDRIYGTQLVWKKPKASPELERTYDLPKFYDCRLQCLSEFRPVCIENGFDQHLCGNDWAIAATTAIGDTYSLHHKLNSSPQPSAAFLTSCFNTPDQNACCRKISLYDVATYLTTPEHDGSSTTSKVPGIKLRSCWPETVITNFDNDSSKDYQESPPRLDIPSLDDCCWDCCYGNNRSTTEFRISRMQPLYLTHKEGGVNIQETQNLIKQHLVKVGPVVTSFIVTKPFEVYWQDGPSNAVWDPNSEPRPPLDASMKGQSVVIIGYNHDDTGLYWIIRNSWVRPKASKHEDRFTGAIYASKDAEHCYGLDAPIPITIDDTEFFVGGPWAIFLPDAKVDGLGAIGNGPQMDMRIKLRPRIDWLVPVVILIVGIIIVLILIRFVPG